tara:strand:+ start:7416 stop:9026 length:1611 start_codon:yes stop_codon:yes gene_type:complete
MGDFGLYAALSGTDNWAQKRQDKASNLMMLERMEQRSEKQLAAQMQAEAGIQEQLDLMAQFDVLPEDQKALEEVEQRARMNIIKGITKFNGDLKKYVSSGGLTDLGEYKRSILTSSEMKNAVSNKAQYAQYIDAKQKDMFVGKAEIDVPVFDSKGNPKMKDGEIVRERKRLSMEEQMALRKRGLLDRIQVGMIEKKGSINPQFFKKNFKDPLKPWSADNIVTEKNVYDYLISTGTSEEQANEMANKYGKQHAGSPETAMKWNAMNPYDLEFLKSKIQYNQSRGKGKGKGSSKTQITNTLGTTYDKLKQQPGEMMPTEGPNASPNALGAAKPMTPRDTKFFTEWLNNTNPKVYDMHYGNRSEDDVEDNKGKYDLRGATVNLIQKLALTNPDNGNVESFIKAKVFYPEAIADQYNFKDTYNRRNWQEGVKYRPFINDDEKTEIEEIPGYTGYVYINVENLVKDKGFAAEHAKFRNIGTNVQAYEPGNTNQGDMINNEQIFQQMVSNTIRQINPNTNQPYTQQEAEELVNYSLSKYGYQ